MNIKKVKELLEENIFNGQAYEIDDVLKGIYKGEFDYFCEFFDTSKLTIKEAYDFLHDKDNVEYLDIIVRKLKLETEKSFFEYIRDLSFSNGFPKIICYFGDDEQELNIFLNIIVKGILWISFIEPYYERIKNNQVICSNDIFTNQYNENTIDDNYYFRGQANYSWNLNPSFLRGFHFEKYDGCLIDNATLYKLYFDSGLVDKVNETIGKDRVHKPSDINYGFLSFMQHAISYSPLIDFTSDLEVACKFALNKNNPNEYIFNDSSIYILYDSKTNENDNEIININVEFLNKKIVPGTHMTIVNHDGKEIDLDFTTIPKIKERLRPKYKILHRETNDRMKYQKGIFILFNDYVSVNGNVYYLLNEDFLACKRRIDKNSKDKILTKISKNEKIRYSYLMNPYLYFND